MLKAYRERTPPGAVTHQPNVTSNCLIQELGLHSAEKEVEEDLLDSTLVLKNSDVLSNLKDKLHHLSASEQHEMTELIQEFPGLFPGVPIRTGCVYHDVDIGDAKPIKQHPYHVNPNKLKHLRKEVEYMVKHGII